MIVEDKRKKKEIKKVDIGDMIITNVGYYLLLDNSCVDCKYSIAIYNIFLNRIEMTTQQKVFCINGTLGNEEIVDIIPSENLKIVIKEI